MWLCFPLLRGVCGSDGIDLGRIKELGHCMKWVTELKLWLWSFWKQTNIPATQARDWQHGGHLHLRIVIRSILTQLCLIIWAVQALGWLLEIIEEKLWQPLVRKLLSLSQLHWQKLGQPIEQSLLLKKCLSFVSRLKEIVWGLYVLCNPRNSAKPCMVT